MLGSGSTTIEGGNGSPGRVPIAACLLHLKTADQPGLGSPIGDLQGFRLAAQIVPGNRQARLIGPQLHVIERHFCHQTDLGSPHVRDAGVQISLSRLQCPAGPPEDIGLPACIETRRVEGLVRSKGGASRHARGCADRRKPVGRCQIPIGTGRPQGCTGAAQIRVGPKGILDQAGELRVGQLFPPTRQATPRLRDRADGRHRLPGGWNGRFRYPVIRADGGTRAKQTDQQHRQQAADRGRWGNENGGKHECNLEALRAQRSDRQIIHLSRVSCS
jgi:hypothetical protein